MDYIFLIIAAVVVIGGAYVFFYNRFIVARQKVKEAWSGIDVQLKRRYDLIPNLINTVKGYAKHEQQTLENLTKARSAAMAIPRGDVAQQAEAENILSGTLKSLFALAENYPDLKASQNFLDLQNQLTETEDQISSARRIYNRNVAHMNTLIESFPSNIVARNHGFSLESFFELDKSEQERVKEVPKVTF
jgi:LemA protein